MDTNEARRRMRDLARETLEILDSAVAEDGPRGKAISRVAEMEQESRALLADAGYPGESVWRGLQRARLALEAGGEDQALELEASAEMRESLERLDSLIAAASERESDFRIVG
jgi:hypothetical protein